MVSRGGMSLTERNVSKTKYLTLSQIELCTKQWCYGLTARQRVREDLQVCFDLKADAACRSLFALARRARSGYSYK
jgi:hypothetical protein